ncbi:bifunctional DNA primase/polymerase [Streptomyces sp. B22F1]|uniref:bifunctional DNA primase/polymerase n=1 Tax=Streptomyces sp. B22F1 TaxID=3153566 RepID=UPI00325E5A3F
MTQPPDNPRALLAAALAAAEHGWPVFPLRPGTKRPALHSEARCPGIGACARGHRKWEQRATTDPDRIRAAWSAGAFNIGIATGPAGLVVIDLDVAKDERDAPGGAATFKALCERTGQPAPTTFTLRTASGGEHRYFTAPPGVRLGNTAGSLAPHVDTRAWGGYVVAAGSAIDGRAYTVTDPAPPAPLPAWLCAALARSPRPVGPVATPRSGNASAYASAALRDESTNVRDAPEGQRDATLLRAARALGRFIASGDLSRPVVEEALQGSGEAAGLPARQCASTIRSGLDWSIAHNPQGRAA